MPRGNHTATYVGIQENNTLHHQIELTSIQPVLPSCRTLRRGMTATSIRLISLYYLSRGGTGINPSNLIPAEEIIQHYPCRLHTAQLSGIPCFTSINAITTSIHAIPHPLPKQSCSETQQMTGNKAPWMTQKERANQTPRLIRSQEGFLFPASPLDSPKLIYFRDKFQDGLHCGQAGCLLQGGPKCQREFARKGRMEEGIVYMSKQATHGRGAQTYHQQEDSADKHTYTNVRTGRMVSPYKQDEHPAIDGGVA